MRELLPEKLRDELRLDKYGRWAVDLTLEEVRGLLWLVGEFAVRVPPLDLPDAHPRCRAALRVIARFHRIPFTVEDWRALLIRGDINA